MDGKEITDRELKIIEEIAKNRGITQRELSRKAGISLGMVNISLKRLIRKGYVKVKGMNKRSLEYILTPKGFSEKAKKSYRYFLNTLDSLKKMKEKIQSLILTEYTKGARNFVILGDGELADIVEMSLKSLAFDDVKYKRVKDKGQIKEKNCVVLSTQEKYRKIPQVKNWIRIMDKITG
ncbi:MarR family transcriptional regulator [Candidatus Aerophobetes bacterium]|uniref:MarR family transcriptional regulator n=1 Tax=Aerophobetes bacterium TaxID=2030807 RepID=A0A662DHR7_UNCAE|nr:MAG: MarR family transcriptional regulator [Candidatus Aerophobetes bacterium]